MKLNDLWFSFLVVSISSIALAISLPYIPVDETRYLSVAWEMWHNDSFIVPIFNGLPYAHKPPLLFWLIHLDWFIFGVNESSLRFIPACFSLLNLALTYKIAMQLWNDRITATYATLILSSMLIYLMWSSLIMFDVILTFWVLLGIYGFLSAAIADKQNFWVLVSIAIAGGTLTKGPVILVHLLPVSFLYFLWRSNNNVDNKKWYFHLLLSFLLSLTLIALWIVPAIVIGGDDYTKAILWGQTANRLVSSFAHQQPVWWYLPILPILLFPWLLMKPAWSGYSLYKTDNHYRLLAIWFILSVISFSLISGKNIHYLLPIIPAFSLLLAKHIALHQNQTRDNLSLSKPFALIHICAGIFIFILSFSTIVGHLTIEIIRNMKFFAIGIFLLGVILLLFRPNTIQTHLKLISLSSLFTLLILILLNQSFITKRYDLHDAATFIKHKQESGYTVMHYQKYHGQFHFIGRLTQPLIVINNKVDLNQYMNTHNKIILITYVKRDKLINSSEKLFEHAYRSSKLVILNKKGIQSFLQFHMS